MRMNRPCVFFETITQAHRPLVAWYLARGYHVLVFDFTYRLKFMGWLRRLIHAGRVERIYFHPASRAEGLAMDAAEWWYPQAAHHPLVQRMNALMRSDETAPIFKYALVQHLCRYFYMRLYLERWTSIEVPGSTVTLIPEAFGYWDRLLRPWCDTRLPACTDLRIPWWARAWGAVARECNKIGRQAKRYVAGGLCLCVAAAARMIGRRRATETPWPYRCVYAIETKFQAKTTGHRRFDFLLDHRELTQENTLFLVGGFADGPWVAQARAEGHRVIRRAEYSGWRGLLRHPPRTLAIGPAVRACLTGLRHLGAPEWLHDAAGSGLWMVARETSLVEQLARARHYVYTNQYGLMPRWRNVLLRTHGVESWFFAYSNGGGFMYRDDQPFASGGDFDGRVRFWAYENVDHFVSPCPQLIAYHQRHHQRVRHYHNIGNLWSEQVRVVEAELDRDALLAEWFGPLSGGRKVIAWFDTTFVEAPTSPSTFTEAIHWYGDILRLVTERDDVLMVIKPSKDEAYYVDEGPRQQWSVPALGRELLRVWEQLRVHPRVRLLDHQADATTVIAASDLTVTYCFSSVSAEALGANKRGIWYEPGQRWRETFFGRKPLLTAHGYAELRHLVQTLLFGMSNEAYQDYLERRIRGLVEDFLDGKGLTRFRALLTGAEAPSRAGADVAEPDGACVTGDRR